jgi:tRNA 2-selenouridine synthase
VNSPILFDARSPSEYAHAHIPGALNLPLLDDEHRRIIGITYKQEGREAAVLKGFDLVGPRFGDLVRQANGFTDQREVSVYCWRGGMRSQILAWVLQLYGFKVTILKGGYKAYRRRILVSCQQARKVVVLGGRTGSGKTELLKHLATLGEQVIDLEALAHHKGSSFGSLGEPPQPRYEYFENLLAEAWEASDPERILWIENESRTIGKVKIPDSIFDSIRNAPMIEAIIPLSVRKERILQEYGRFPKEDLIEATNRLKKRLGGLRMQDSIQALLEGRKEEWLEHLLVYYDKTYDYGTSLRIPSTIYPISLHQGENYVAFARRIQQLSSSITF